MGEARPGGHEQRWPPATLGARRHRVHRSIDFLSATFDHTHAGPGVQLETDRLLDFTLRFIRFGTDQDIQEESP